MGFASQQAIEALQWTHDRVWKDRSLVICGSDEWKALGMNDGFQALAQGRIATWESGSWAPAQFAADHPANVQDWDIAISVMGPVRRATSASIDAWVVPNASKVQDAAWDFMKFLQSSDYLDLQCQIASIQHARVSMQDRYVQIMKKIPALADKNIEAFADVVRKQYGYPNGGVFQAKDEEVFGLFREAWSQSIVKNEVAVAVAFQDAAKRAEAVMAEK